MVQIQVVIPQIPPVGSVDPAAEVEIDQGGASYSATVSQIGSAIAPIVISSATVASIAALKAFAISAVYVGTNIYVEGYSTAGDGGEGYFRVTSSNPGTDNGGTIIWSATSGYYFIRQFIGPAYPEWFGAKGDGVTNDAAAIQAALNAVSNVQLRSKIYGVSTPLGLNVGQTLRGPGPQRNNGGLYLLNSANCEILTFADINALGEDITITDLHLDGNKTNQASGGNGIIYFNENNIATGIARIWLSRVMVENGKDRGIHLHGYGRGSFFTDVQVYNCDNYLWDNSWSDCHFENIDLGDGGVQNLIIKAPGTWVNLKSWKAGLVTSGNGVGIYIQSGGVIIQDSWVQDCTSYGLYLAGTVGSPIQNCQIELAVDSCGSYACGIADYVNNNYLRVAASNRSGGIGTLTRVFRMAGTPTNIFNNELIGSGLWDGTLIYAFDPAANWGGVNRLIVGDRATGSNPVTYASTVTLNAQTGSEYVPITLTGNITIAAPIASYDGAMLTLSLSQDGTGGRTMTFNSAFDVSWTPSLDANARNVITFRYSANSSKWVQISPSRYNIVATSTVTYSASMTPDLSLGLVQKITATNNTAYTINNPINPITGTNWTLQLVNSAGGALGAQTLGAAFKATGFTQPANTKTRFYGFFYDGTNHWLTWQGTDQ